jgi:hypothetical protein
LGFRHWFERSRSWQRTHRITRRRDPQRHLLRQINRLHQNRRDDRDLAKAIEGRHLRELRKALRPTVRGSRGESQVQRRLSAGAKGIRLRSRRERNGR